ncbi:MAG: outer membrane beta-barrel protein [Gemmatimonadota bacterium]|nr:outer membrane beta-barrel protein [Gemmatimonadota bacterium]
MKRRSLVLLSILFLHAAASPALAQTTLSLTGGLNRTAITADPPGGAVWRSESLTRMSVGLAATVPVSEHLGLQLGVAYSQKGGRLSGLDGDILVTSEIALDYFEFSLLAVPTFALSSWDRSSVRFFAGPTMASRIDCDFGASAWLGTARVTTGGGCDAGWRDEVEAALDLGVVVGGGIAVGVTERAGVSVDLLYTLGLIPIGEGDSYWSGPKQRVLTLRTGVTLPVG